MAPPRRAVRRAGRSVNGSPAAAGAAQRKWQRGRRVMCAGLREPPRSASGGSPAAAAAGAALADARGHAPPVLPPLRSPDAVVLLKHRFVQAPLISCVSAGAAGR